MLVEHLPIESSLARELAGEESFWGLGEHLAAQVVDELRVANWQRANAGTKRHQQTEPPKPTPRPGVSAPASPNRLTDAELRRRLEEQRARA